MDAHVIVAGLRVLADLLEMFVGIRPAGDLRALLAADGEHDRRRRLRPRIESRVLHDVMAPAMTLQAAFPQQANDVDRLFQHLLPNGCRGPSAADDMLVQVLARAEPEKE